MSDLSAQPSVATKPSRASTATTIPPGNSRAASFTNSGSLRAAVPITTRDTPRSNQRSEEHTSELQSLMRISYAVFCLKKKKTYTTKHIQTPTQYQIHHNT